MVKLSMCCGFLLDKKNSFGKTNRGSDFINLIEKKRIKNKNFAISMLTQMPIAIAVQCHWLFGRLCRLCNSRHMVCIVQLPETIGVLADFFSSEIIIFFRFVVWGLELGTQVINERYLHIFQLFNETTQLRKILGAMPGLQCFGLLLPSTVARGNIY